MGRYFQRAFWPSGDFELVVAEAGVDGTSVNFHSSGGVHLIFISATYRNDTLAAAFVSLTARLDGDGLSRLGKTAATLAAGATAFLVAQALIEIPAGPHNLTVFAAGVAAVGDVIEADSGTLLAIEFPSWESTDRID